VAQTSQQILDKLKISGPLPTPKGVALQVIELTRREEVTNHDLVQLIGVDPALSQRVVKAANALLGHVSRPVVTIHDAVTVLGMRALRQLVLGIALVADYRHGPCANFDYPGFWQHSLLTALCVRRLALRANLMAAEEVFMLGLLGQIGRLVLATAQTEAFSDLLEQHEPEQRLFELEQAQFGFNHAEVSAAMLAEMNFPLLFQALVRDYRVPQTSKTEPGSREWQLLRSLHLAGLLADLSPAPAPERAAAVTAVRRAAAELAIEESELLELAAACMEEAREWSALLGMGSPSLPDLTSLFTAPEVLEEASEPPSFVQSPHDYKMRVLVVEDDRAMRALMAQWLNAAGHRVNVAENGVEALNLAELHRPQVVITDWRMPQMDGIALCRELRRLPAQRNTYLIMITVETIPDKLVEAFEAGTDDYPDETADTQAVLCPPARGAACGAVAGRTGVRPRADGAFFQRIVYRQQTPATAGTDRRTDRSAQSPFCHGEVGAGVGAHATRRTGVVLHDAGYRPLQKNQRHFWSSTG